MIAVASRSMMEVWRRRGEGRLGNVPVDRFSLERAEPRVVGAVCSHGVDLFALGDLVQQLWQDRAVAVAAGGNSTARMSDVAVFMARYTLRHWRRP